LTEFESTRRNANTFQFIDLCKVCFEDVKPFVPTIDRADLITEADLDEEPEEGNLDSGVSTGLDDIIIDTIENYRDYDEHEEH
jgi:hypothetical protein